ncbi:putative quinol monooxygenase [Parabacteroides sp.]
MEKKEKKTIVCRVLVKEGQEAAFTAVAKTLVEATRQEAGNISYNLYQSPFDPQSFIFYEEYKDDDAFNFHANSDHFKAFANAIPDMLAAGLNIEQF